jgi:hypothetical protein
MTLLITMIYLFSSAIACGSENDSPLRSSVNRSSSTPTPSSPNATGSETPEPSQDPYENGAVDSLRSTLATIGLTDLDVQEGEFRAANLGGPFGGNWLNARLRPVGRHSAQGRVESSGRASGIEFMQVVFGGSRFLRFECGSSQIEISVTPNQLSPNFIAKHSQQIVAKLGRANACS